MNVFKPNTADCLGIPQELQINEIFLDLCNRVEEIGGEILFPVADQSDFFQDVIVFRYKQYRYKIFIEDYNTIECMLDKITGIENHYEGLYREDNEHLDYPGALQWIQKISTCPHKWYLDLKKEIDNLKKIFGSDNFYNFVNDTE